MAQLGKKYYLAIKDNAIEDYSDNTFKLSQAASFSTVKEQTLNAGDILLTAYRMSATNAEDEISFISLVDIAPGINIMFTDSKYTSNAQPQCTGGIVWTSPAEGLTAGTPVQILTSGMTTSLGNVSGSSYGLSSSGDQIIVYTGTAAEPVYITALSSNAWVSSNTKCGGSVSILQKTLVDGQTSINLSTAPGKTSGNTVNAYYKGPQTGSQTGLRLAILNPANWVGIGADTPAQQWPAWAFSVNPLSTSISKKVEGFTVYPNPVKGSTVYFNRKVDVTVYKSLGQLITFATNIEQLDVSGYKKGVYYIKTKDGNSKRVIVN